MPLRDHFHPPIDSRLPWPSLHSGWLGTITERLNVLLPPEYLALDSLHLRGGLEIDIATAERDEVGSDPAPADRNGSGGTAVATLPAVYTPPTAVGSATFAIPDAAEIRVYIESAPRRLVGAIELVSPSNKDRPETRAAFVGKCLDYLGGGASVVIVDVVTDRHASLHNELVRAIGAPVGTEVPEGVNLYAAAYRPVIRQKTCQLDIWVNPFAVGDSLPTMPLRLIADHFVPVELETTYTEACRRRRLI